MAIPTSNRLTGRRAARSTHAFVLAALSVTLGGCFYSSEMKFPLSSAAPALGEGGRYTLYTGWTEPNARLS
jgi:hypothetical protein